jgi:outer membrane beta-barrel protein
LLTATLVLSTVAAAETVSIQQRPVFRRERIELSPSFGVSVSDPFYTRLGGSLRAAYWLAETLAVGVRGTFLSPLPGDDSKVVPAPRVHGVASADVEWAPFYGKLALWDSILYFDGYVLGGLGAAVASDARLAFELGGGVRVIVREAVALRLELVDFSYLESAALQNVVTVQAGLSVLLPLTAPHQ